MGGRGTSSGLSGKQSKFEFSVSGLAGSEKQKAWAQRIVDDALNTVNANIRNFTTGKQKDNPGAKDTVEGYKMVGESIIKTLKGVKSASQIIDNRRGVDPSAINRWVDQYEQRKKRRR